MVRRSAFWQAIRANYVKAAQLSMTTPISKTRMRATKEIHRDCVQKLRSIETSAMFLAILASLLDEDWTTPNISELRITSDDRLFGRSAGEANFKAFRCAKHGLVRSIHRLASVARLDGDELGYLLGKVAGIPPM